MILLVFLQSKRFEIQNFKNLAFTNSLGIFSFFLILFYMGLRPVSGEYFVDMATYARQFQAYSNGEPINEERDVYFEYFTKFCTTIMSLEVYFQVLAILYLVPLYVASRRIFKEYWYYAFLMIISSLIFWNAGVNGIRNGVATSFFLLGISYSNKKIVMACFMAVAFAFHKSTLLLIAIYLFTTFYKNTKYILAFWFLSILLSLALGGFWESFFLNFGFGEDERLTGYLSTDQDDLDMAVKVGFRWDFLLYSATGVYTGWYFIFKKKFEDIYYNHLFNIYLLANATWILVIRANYSNRFAYLSWFMLGVIIIYPLLKIKFFTKQHEIVGKIILGYFLFTYLLNVILAK
ncbi:EpsG family protein [Flavobacterium sp.]|uniref:EpsG family protein n=1 Tax=Flavobacterium sp. TaxID=239 RepID=UPI00344FA950